MEPLPAACDLNSQRFDRLAAANSAGLGNRHLFAGLPNHFMQRGNHGNRKRCITAPACARVCSRAAMRMRILSQLSRTFQPICAARGRRAPNIHRGRCWSTCGLRNRDILEFSRNPKHKSPDWPVGYWPGSKTPPDEKAWDKSVRAFRRDLKAMCDLVADEKTDLFAKIPHGDGQTILREALLVARSQCLSPRRAGAFAASVGRVGVDSGP